MSSGHEPARRRASRSSADVAPDRYRQAHARGGDREQPDERQGGRRAGGAASRATPATWRRAHPCRHRHRRRTRSAMTCPPRRYGPAPMRLIVARCSVEYSGRLTARLPEALRLLMLKADGSVLVHADARRLQAAELDDAADGRSRRSRRPHRRAQAQGRGPARDPRSHEVSRDVDARDGRRRRAAREGRRRGAPAGGCWPTRRSGAARASGSCGASGRPTSGRST